MAIFSESAHTFKFDERWTVLKYDDHHYYQIVSGRSFSGIDFAGLLHDEALYLIEVKNFFQYKNQGHIDDVDQFVIEIREKILDTIDLINLIHKYHKRSLLYRTCIRLVMRFPKLHFNWWFWTRMHQMIAKESVSFILLLESAHDPKYVLKRIENSIGHEVNSCPRIQVFSFSNVELPGLEISSEI